MRLQRRHACALVAILAVLPLSGADCLSSLGGGDKEREECVAVCAAEAQCDLGRDEAACLAALCGPDGFLIVADGETPADLESLSANDCMKAAEDCAALALCSCDDSCARVAECTGNNDATCADTCEALLEQDTSLYLENRCRMESTCADLAACGQVG